MNWFSLSLLWSCYAACLTGMVCGREPPARRLTQDGVIKRDPVYIAGGTRVVYCSRNASPRLVIRSIEVQSTGRSAAKPQRLHPDSTLVEFLPTFSRDEARHAFVRMTGNDQASIMVFEAKTQKFRSLKAARKVAWNAALSPLGDAVVYNLSGQIYRQELASGKETKLTESSGRNDWPSFSPDGKRIAFCSSRDGDYEIYICRADGSNVRRLTKSAGLDIRPRWSPDGKSLVFTSNRDRNYEIYLMASDGSAQRRLTFCAERDDYASWHPEGNRIVFVGERDGSFDLYELPVRHR